MATSEPCRRQTAVWRLLLFIAGAWTGLDLKRIVRIFLLCLAWSVIEILALARAPLQGPWSAELNSVLSMQFNGFAVMLAVLVADRASPPPLRRWWPYVIAVLVGVGVGTTLFWFVSQRLFTIPSAWQLRGAPDGFSTLAFRHATSRLAICGLATYVYVCWRWASQRQAALRSVQIERVKVEKRLLETRLAAMQARIEPQFLLSTLAETERLYELDAAAGDRMLRELTVYLRAAIPRLDDPASTVGAEVRLANAFLNIVARTVEDRLVLSDAGAAIADTARMPAMTLLPLVNHALARRPGRSHGDGAFEIDVAARDEQLTITVRDPGMGFSGDGSEQSAIDQLRKRLAALYGTGASLILRETLACTEAVMEIPYEVARAMPP